MYVEVWLVKKKRSMNAEVWLTSERKSTEVDILFTGVSFFLNEFINLDRYK
jgi:hypothetical protein